MEGCAPRVRSCSGGDVFDRDLHCAQPEGSTFCRLILNPAVKNEKKRKAIVDE